MSELHGACIIGQSGGPSSAINASTLGAIQTALASECITKVLGAHFGIKGVLNDDLLDMSLENKNELELMKNTPSSILGSCRYKLKPYEEDPADYERILEIFKKYNVRYFFYNGGNDSMDTCMKVSAYMQKVGYDCRVMGIPKTIDNDLFGTDHCPGFGSAAKYIATSAMEICHDSEVYGTGGVNILEIMGRNAGWLTGAAALADYMGKGPDLIYLPEVTFDIEKTLKDIERIYKKNGHCLVAISEGIKDAQGNFISTYASKNSSKDAFGHVQMGGAGSYLAQVIKEKLEISKVRVIEFSLLQRCAAHCASKTDIDESYMAGCAAVTNAINGITDKMVGFKRTEENGKYKCEIELINLKDCANAEKKVPREWINAEGNGVTKEFIDYALPLIEGEVTLKTEKGLPRFARLNKIPAKA